MRDALIELVLAPALVAAATLAARQWGERVGGLVSAFPAIVGPGAALAWAAGRVGAEAGGVLAALPVLASILAAFTHARLGAEPVTTLLRGMLAGMAGFVCFCALVATLAEPAGIAAAFTAAALATVAVQAVSVRGPRRRHEGLGESSSSTYTPIGRAPARRAYAAKPG